MVESELEGLVAEGPRRPTFCGRRDAYPTEPLAEASGWCGQTLTRPSATLSQRERECYWMPASSVAAWTRRMAIM